LVRQRGFVGQLLYWLDALLDIRVARREGTARLFAFCEQ